MNKDLKEIIATRNTQIMCYKRHYMWRARKIRKRFQGNCVK